MKDLFGVDVKAGKGVPSWQAPPLKWRQHACKQCGKEFYPKKSDRTTCCSRACGFVWANREASAAKIERLEREAKAKAERQANLKAERELKRLAKEAEREKRKQELGSRRCARCEKLVGLSTKNLSARSYCVACIRKARNKAGKRTLAYQKDKRARRKAEKLRIRCVTVEVFDPADVLNRDGWKCHLCGCRTPKSLRGTYHPRAPELDHIVPLAVGGAHSKANTACACRSCNGIKAHRPLGQMRLLG